MGYRAHTHCLCTARNDQCVVSRAPAKLKFGSTKLKELTI